MLLNNPIVFSDQEICIKVWEVTVFVNELFNVKLKIEICITCVELQIVNCVKKELKFENDCKCVHVRDVDQNCVNRANITNV